MISNSIIFDELAKIFLPISGEFTEDISIEDDFKVNYERNKKQINNLASEMRAAAHELDCVLKNLSLLFEKDLENYFFKKDTNTHQQKNYLEYIKPIYMGAIPLTKDFIMISKLNKLVDPNKNYDYTNMEKLNPIEEQILSFETTLTEFEDSINSKYNSFLILLEKEPQLDNSEKEKILFPKLKAFLSNYDHFVKSDNSSLDKILSVPFSAQLKSIDDLIDELKKLLLNKETKEAKGAILKNHIVDLMEIWSLFNIHKDLINSEIPKPKNEFEKYVLLCYELNQIVFNELQMLCYTNGISFFELCKDLKIEPKFIDCSISMYFEEDQPQLDSLRNSHTEEKTKSKEKKLQPYKDKTPNTFEDLFYNPKEADSYLDILKKVEPPFICENNKYIGNNKGIFPLWVDLLTRRTKIRSFSDKTIYSKLLNKKIENLNLSKDASEFRKHYRRIEQNDYDLQIINFISQISQSGKLGK